MATSIKDMNERKTRGAHYTPRLLAEFVARQIAGAWNNEGRPNVLDPGVGDGELVLALLNALSITASTPSLIQGFDTDSAALQNAQRRLEAAWPNVPTSLAQTDFLHDALQSAGGSSANLFAPITTPRFDIVIANPPYVRTQVMGAAKAQRLAALFGLSGRVDLYFAFLLGIARVLKPGGVAGVIVSNRFMTTKAGAAVRRYLREHFDILHAWDLGDTRLFDAAVLPAVLLLRRRGKTAETRPSRFTSIYSAIDDGSATDCDNVLTALSQSGLVRLPAGAIYRVQQGLLCLDSSSTAVWRLASEATDTWLATVASHTHCMFGEVGKVRVGVKTTADKVFISDKWLTAPDESKPELLRPLMTHHAGRRYRSLEPVYEIIYPHMTIQGKRRAVDLDEYPRSAFYLEQHRSQLESRDYVIKAGRNWFEIWVPQDPDLWALPKLVFRDIAEQPTFWLDLDGSVVNGDCYWMVARPGMELDLLWLALAVANSTFIESFYDRRFNNKLYSGRRRFMTQYVEQFPIPDPHTRPAKKIIEMAKILWQNGPHSDIEAEIDCLVWQAFGLSIEEVAR